MEKDKILEGQKIVNNFVAVQGMYANRETSLTLLNDLFEGDHWGQSGNDPSVKDEKDSSEGFQLVLNYVRRVVLSYVASLSRAPVPRAPVTTNGEKAASERLLRTIWGDFLDAWYDVELNASKLSYGVLQVLWSPDENNVRDKEVDGEVIGKQYLSSPFIFRSIRPDRFYPVYRTYSRPDDFFEVYRYDPGRITEDIARVYEVDLQSTGTTLLGDPNFTLESVHPTCDLIEYWSRTEYVLVAQTTFKYRKVAGLKKGAERKETFAVVLEKSNNPYGSFPFWVLQNIRSNGGKNPTYGGSLSDIEDVFQLNQHLNQMFSEEAEQILKFIHPTLLYKTDYPQQSIEEIENSPGKVIPIGTEEDVDALDPPRQPVETTGHMDRTLSSIQDLTFLGEAGFGAMRSGTSGIAARIALTPFEQALELKLPHRVSLLKRACSFILRVFRTKMKSDQEFVGWINRQHQRFDAVVLGPQDIPDDYFVDIRYGNLLPRDDSAFEQNEGYKYKLGMQSLRSTLDNIGVDDPDLEIRLIRQELQDAILHPENKIAQIKLKQAEAELQQTTLGGQQNLPTALQNQLQPANPQSAPMMGLPGPQMMPQEMNQPGMGMNQPGLLPSGNQPPVPTEQAAPRTLGGGAGITTPFMGRGGKNA